MRTAIGLMSGTSFDGIDAALITTDGQQIQSISPHSHFEPYASDLKQRIRQAIAGKGNVPALEKEITLAHAEAVQHLLTKAGIAPQDVDVIGFHGQTIRHAPEQGVTVQLGDGALLASRTGIRVVFDFRSNDVRHGGQGAPLVPLYHQALVAGQILPVALVNIGGVANVTYIDTCHVLAMDTGPGNALLDDWIFRHTGKHYDESGQLAQAGAVDAQLLEQWLEDPYFLRKPPKSLDRNHFTLTDMETLSLEDGAATLAALTIHSIARSAVFFPDKPKAWYITGGGRHNRYLMQGLQKRIHQPVKPIEALGCDGDMLEAQAFAFLAVRTLLGLPLSLPTTTGVKEPVTGGRVAEVA